MMDNMSLREEAVYLTKTTGVLPAIKLKAHEDLLPYAHAMYDGGARVIEITMTTPGVLDSFRAISAAFGRKLFLAAGTVLDAATARAAIEAGAGVIVSPVVIPEVIDTANRYRLACFSGAFTATECLAAMQAGADMVKIFPARLGGPSYMTNLRMVFPEVNLIPSGGISLETAGEYIRCGACAVSGARNFFDREMVIKHGITWISQQTATYIKIVAEAKADAHPLP
ncbi:MAG TPA: bifunctional 4-hydroxy-2-oxoglutarate aldolase/2-dehydro-3-deoxy-phosphogluconate aldolase [Aggregatilineales bacterium]|nr:bifunctional 4-hydroxy-2-oxoglutarate aldolase/2-dehydro-3-deoxy-phosphogluconate aldolase [Aggregatilineales bacterium]